MLSDKAFTELVDLSPAFMAVTIGGRLVFINKTAMRLLHLDSMYKALGRPVKDFVAPNYLELFENDCEQLLQLGDHIPMQLNRDDGEEVQLEIAAHEIAHQNDKAILLAARDVTDLYHAAEAVRTREERLKQILDTVVDAIITIDHKGIIQKFNKAAERMFGYRSGSVIGRNISILMPEKEAAEHDGHMERYLADRQAHVIGIGREVTARRKDGSTFPVELALSEMIFDGKSVFTGVLRDVTERKRAEEKLRFLALYDRLTNLPNRAYLNNYLTEILAQANHVDDRFAIIGVDIDRFKNVNDLFGHAFGDKILKIIAQRIREEIGEGDFLARAGGDEFAIVVDISRRPDHAENLAKRILEKLPEPLMVDSYELFVSATVGVVTFPEAGDEPGILLKNLETTKYHGKERGRNTCLLYSESIVTSHAEMLAMETELRKSFESKTFNLYFQPKIDISTGRVAGMEALLRWRHDEFGFVSPAKFVPVAEETGLIIELGNWVLETGCQQCVHWIENGFPDLKIAVNLSPRQFRDSGLVDRVRATLEKTGLPPEKLELEITESGLMDETENVVELLHRLKALGVSIAIDDFGTGYSSLSYLKRFPLDVLKIDQSFVRGIPHDQGDVSICSAIIAMAKSMRLNIVAEGVETPEQLAFLKSKNCDIVQGFGFSPPLNSKDFEEYLREADEMIQKKIS